MTVAENIVLATSRRKAGVLLDHAAAARARARARASVRLRRRSGRARSQDISVGQQQRVEILKALYRKADILILDEPTAVLTPQEAVELFAHPRHAHARGHVDHLHHPQAQRGARDRRPHHGAAAREDVETLPRRRDRGGARAADGRARGAPASREDARASPGEPLLEVEDLHVRDDRGLEAGARRVVRGARGEIVGIAGVDGNGQTELIEALTGLCAASTSGPCRRRRARRHGTRARKHHRRRRRAHPRGPPAARSRPRLHARREPRAARLRRSRRTRASDGCCPTRLRRARGDG